MTSDESFLAAIIESPDDDSPRLIYADWLEDHGQPDRAEFIRVACTLEKLGEDDPRRTCTGWSCLATPPETRERTSSWPLLCRPG
jgi:uncharacterized protein (TIGR02996 family)